MVNRLYDFDFKKPEPIVPKESNEKRKSKVYPSSFTNVNFPQSP